MENTIQITLVEFTPEKFQEAKKEILEALKGFSFGTAKEILTKALNDLEWASVVVSS